LTQALEFFQSAAGLSDAIVLFHYNYSDISLILWVVVAHGRVEAFRPEGRAFKSRHVDLGQVLNSQLPVAPRRESPAQYPCCVGSAS